MEENTKYRKDLLEKIRSHQMASLIHLSARWELSDLVGEGRRLSEISELLSVDTNCLRRMLKSLQALGIFKIDKFDYISQTNFSLLLMRNHPGSLHAAACFWGLPIMWDTWSNLEFSIKTGKSAFENKVNQSLFDYFNTNRYESEAFNQFMMKSPENRHSAVTDAYDFSQASRIVDIGGGNGQLIVEILEAFPQAYGILCERQEVIHNIIDELQEFIDHGRGETQDMDFFEEIPKGEDIYLLSQIIHDWDDSKCLKILKNCRSSLRNDSILLIIERIPEDEDIDKNFFLSDMEMLLLHQSSERSKENYYSLLQDSGFNVNRLIKTNSPFSIIESVPS